MRFKAFERGKKINLVLFSEIISHRKVLTVKGGMISGGIRYLTF